MSAAECSECGICSPYRTYTHVVDCPDHDRSHRVEPNTDTGDPVCLEHPIGWRCDITGKDLQ